MNIILSTQYQRKLNYLLLIEFIGEQNLLLFAILTKSIVIKYPGT